VLRVVAGNNGAAFTVNASLVGIAVYLDNFAIIDLAEGDVARRQQFVSALHSGAELLFSVSNLVDLTGPTGASLDTMKVFLDEVGAHWFPVELDPAVVVERERKGEVPAMNCLSERFLRDFFADRLRANSGKIINLSPDFFRLGAVLEWIGPQRDSIRAGLVDLDNALIKRIDGYRANFERDPDWLDRAFPAVPFNPSKPATFAYLNLVRNLILDAAKGRKIKKGDGLDFCHTVIACGCASAAMLDKYWKRRVELLPQPNNIAPVYYGPDLDKLVADLYACTVQNAGAAVQAPSLTA
jgi:hypothetical protein